MIDFSKLPTTEELDAEVKIFTKLIQDAEEDLDALRRHLRALGLIQKAVDAVVSL
jgi:hypothetical protein